MLRALASWREEMSLKNGAAGYVAGEPLQTRSASERSRYRESGSER